MRYEEIVKAIKGKPSKATLRVNLGGATVKMADAFIRTLEPSAVLHAFNNAREVKFTGKPEEGEDSGQGQTATFQGKQVAPAIAAHFGLSLKEEKGKGETSANGVGTAGEAQKEAANT